MIGCGANIVTEIKETISFESLKLQIQASAWLKTPVDGYFFCSEPKGEVIQQGERILLLKSVQTA